MEYLFQQVSIVGVGLLGGSMGMALRENKLARKIVGLGRNSNKLSLALKKKAVHSISTDWRTGVAGSDLVIICTPVTSILPIIKDLLFDFSDGCIITDVGSTKKNIVEGANKILKARNENVQFVGSHPMAGSEQFGVEASRKDLYSGAACIVTPTLETNRKSLKKVILLWKSLGCRILEMSPAEHDLSVASVSHLPHVLASSLVNLVADLNNQNTQLAKMVATGFRDSTRIASSHPQIWTDICAENRDSILELINLFEKELSGFKKLLKSKDMDELYKKFEKARQFRDSIYNK